MEAARSLLSSPSPFSHKTHIRNCSSSSSSSSSVLMLHEQIAHAPSRKNCRLSIRSVNEEHTSEETLDRMQREAASSAIEDDDTDQSSKFTREQLFQWPGMMPCSVEGLSKQALLASKNAASLFLMNDPVKEGKVIRSTRLRERLSKRRVVKSRVEVWETDRFKRKPKAFYQNDHGRLFLSSPDSKQLLNAKEESELVLHIQYLVKLEKAKVQFQRQFGREPRLAEWAKAVGISQRALLSKLHFCNRSREKLINANLPMVVHVASQYQGRGLPLEDMLQAGSIGLMKSVEKCKPQVDCRFATYAYWWIRQAVKGAIFKHSRTIRLPVNVYVLISKLNEARKSCIQEGNLYPSKEEIASRAGMSVEKMESLQSFDRTTISLENLVWDDDEGTYKVCYPSHYASSGLVRELDEESEIHELDDESKIHISQEDIADDTIEPPELSVAKQVMRGHLHSLLKILSPRERKMIGMRFGMKNGRKMTLAEIGDDFELTKERIRQVFVQTFDKLKQNIHSQDLDTYKELLI